MRVAVAYSGGRDSTALLHATLTASVALGIGVIALHVHHGLNPQADAWSAHCEAQCAEWAGQGLPLLTFAAHRLVSGPRRGDSIEAWARDARYRALGTMAHDHATSLVLLAHHRRDQAETLLLQALRGAGAAGLAAMPVSMRRGGITWARPWLERPREDIEAYVQHHRLRHVDDASNADPRFARNRLRLQVWPALCAAFPHAEAALAAAALRARHAEAALAELAASDVAAIADTDIDTDGLRLALWQALPAGRRDNALRAWLKACLGRSAPASLVQRLSLELGTSSSDARWPAAGGELRRQRGVLRYVRIESQTPAVIARETVLGVHSAGTYELPGWEGRLEVTPVDQGGVPLARLERLDLRLRAGAERFQAGAGRPPRSLKKQYQAAAVPAWDRRGPLVFSGERLVFVPGLGIDARVVGVPGQELMRLRWLPLRPHSAV